MSTKKLFYCYVSGTKQYVHGSNAGQAATSLGHKLGQVIKPEWMKEVKPSYVYSFWYDDMVSDVLAVSVKQAWYYFKTIKGNYPGVKITQCRPATIKDFYKFKDTHVLDY